MSSQRPGETALPFGAYPGGGREMLGGPRSWDNCRHGYGLELQRRTGQTRCAYCDISLTDSYHHWLLMAVDHVVPTSVGKLRGIPPAWMNDCINLVLACLGCNSFGNRYVPAESLIVPEWTVESFVRFRDAIFLERRALIEIRRTREIAFFHDQPWKVT